MKKSSEAFSTFTTNLKKIAILMFGWAINRSLALRILWVKILGVLEGRKMIATLADGEPVFGKKGEDHMKAHAEGSEYMPFVVSQVTVGVARKSSTSHVQPFPRHIGTSSLVAVQESDEVKHIRRVGRRSGSSCVVLNREPAPCSTYTVWLYRNEFGMVVLSTGYVGNITPPEPWTPPALKSREKWEEAKAFWSTHALVFDGKMEESYGMKDNDPEYWGTCPE